MKRFLITCLALLALLVSAQGSYSGEAAGKRFAALMESMRDQDPMVRRAAASSLGETRDAEAVPLLVDVLHADQDPMVRLTALGALEVIGSAAALPAYEKALGDADERVRQGAAHALSGSWGPSAHNALVKALRNETSAKVRRSVAEALGNPGVMGRYSAHGWEGTAITQQALVDALKTDEDYGVRATAAQMLGRFKNGVSLSVLLDALDKDPSVSVRAAAAEALGYIEMPGCVKALMDVVYFERDETLLMAALKSLKYYDDPSILPAAVSALDSASTKVRWQAVDVIGETRSKDAVEPLTRIADDEYETDGVRFKAREALKMIGPR